ncbi:MAG: methyltransferase [Thermaceae bacterium]|nr:methyltransferase [Thermaceae bacterium]
MDSVTLAAYHRLHPIPVPGGELYLKAGARGYGDPQYELLAQRLEPHGEAALDLNPGIGVISQALQTSGLPTTAIEPSRAALRCLEQGLGTKVRILRGLPWEAPPDSSDTVGLVLPANRGTRYVELSLLGAARALRPGGRLWISGSKDRGFERYFKWAQELLGYGVLLERRGAVRVAVLEKERPTPPLGRVWEGFEAEVYGKRFAFRHLPGVFSARHLDPGSQMLLEHLPPELDSVLDLGGGYGALSLPLIDRARAVTLVEDDWASVLSAEASLQANALAASVYHSDVDEALPEGQKFAILLANPPFHVGGLVVLETARAFLEAAQARLERGGRFYLVANRFLPYEPLLAEGFAHVRTLAEGKYKVLLAY